MKTKMKFRYRLAIAVLLFISVPCIPMAEARGLTGRYDKYFFFKYFPCFLTSFLLKSLLISPPSHMESHPTPLLNRLWRILSVRRLLPVPAGQHGFPDWPIAVCTFPAS